MIKCEPIWSLVSYCLRVGAISCNCGEISCELATLPRTVSESRNDDCYNERTVTLDVICLTLTVRVTKLTPRASPMWDMFVKSYNLDFNTFTFTHLLIERNYPYYSAVPTLVHLFQHVSGTLAISTVFSNFSCCSVHLRTNSSYIPTTNWPLSIVLVPSP